jgi:hypothetical protein
MLTDIIAPQAVSSIGIFDKQMLLCAPAKGLDANFSLRNDLYTQACLNVNVPTEVTSAIAGLIFRWAFRRQ